jgi:hypothetical protein
LDARLVDKIVQAQLVGVLEFKLVIVCQKPQQKEWIEYF